MTAAAKRIRGHAAQEARSLHRQGDRATALEVVAFARAKAESIQEIVPYTIRHTMATEMMARGVPELET